MAGLAPIIPRYNELVVGYSNSRDLLSLATLRMAAVASIAHALGSRNRESFGYILTKIPAVSRWIS